MVKNIDKAQNITEIQEIRADHYQSELRNGFNVNSFLGDLYKDDTHFIYELLQNAEDAQAENASFELHQDKLIFTHNGKRKFTIDDIKAITNYGASTKKEDDKLGKFGIGFKSVFSITNSPKIYSGEHNFEIVNFYVPQVIAPIQHAKDDTVFIFEFKKDCYEKLKERLLVIEMETIMFLKHIKLITIIGLGDNKKYEFAKEHKTPYLTIIKTADKDPIEKKEYLFFAQQSKVKDKFDVSVAFILNEKGRITKAQSTFLNVYFPTQIDTQLNFYVNAPFDTKPTREQIKENSEVNNQLFDELVELFGVALDKIKALDLIGVDFLTTLPIKCQSNYYDSNSKTYRKIVSGNTYYRKFWQATHRKLQTGKFMPLSNGGFGTTLTVAFPRPKALAGLIVKNLLEKTFDKSYFISTEITADSKETNELYTYLKTEHSIPVVTLEDFVQELDEYILINVSDKWLMKLYKECNTTPSLAYLYKRTPLIRTEAGNQVDFVNDGMPNIYLSSKNLPAEKQVKSVFMEDEHSRKFFNLLGIKEPDNLEMIKSELLPKIKEVIATKNGIKEYLENFDLILCVYNEIKSNPEKLTQLKNLLRNEKIILAENGKGQKSFCHPSSCVIRNADTELLYEGCEETYLVSKIYQKLTEQNFETFLLLIGVSPDFVIIEYQNKDTNKINLSKQGYQYHIQDSAWGFEIKDYRIASFDKIVENINHAKMLILFRFLISSTRLNSFLSCQCSYKNRLNNKYSYRTSDPLSSRIIEDIENKSLIQINDKQKRIADFTKKEIAAILDINVADIQNSNLFRIISFKSDVIDTLPPREKNILNAANDLTDDEAIEAIEEYKRKRKEFQTQQEAKENGTIADEEIEEYIEENPVEVTIGSGYAGLTLEEISKRNESKSSGKASGNSMPTSTMPRASTTSSEVLKEHGNTAEAIVYKHLFKIYEADDTIEIMLQNENAQTVGYDIVVKKNGVAIEYIEVKSRSNTQAIDVELTGSQWKMAREFDGHATIKFTLCLVSLLKGKTPINFIGNPFTEWKNENLYASPINIITIPEFEE